MKVVAVKIFKERRNYRGKVSQENIEIAKKISVGKMNPALTLNRLMSWAKTP